MKKELTVSILIFFLFALLSTVAKGQQKAEDKSYYQWYGKRFDWILDFYGKHPLDKDSVHLFISEIGKGKDTFLIIHGGFGSEHSYLLDALLPLADRVHFIFYDQRGSLRSSCPDSLISLANHVNDIERIRKAMKIEHINIIAHSMGTLLAMNYLQTYPGKGGKIILLSSLPARLITEEEQKEYYDYQKNYFESLYKDQPTWWLRALKKNGYDTSTYGRKYISQSRYMYMQQFWASGAKVKKPEYWDADANGNTFLYKANVSRAMIDFPKIWDFRKALEKHSFPITIIKPSSDYLSPEMVKHCVQGIPNVTYVQISDCGHNLWLEQPAKFKTEIIKAVLKSK